ncbi:MAG: restriction endonuclease [Abyssibacter sp.]|uniref:restriction endonuclease n=1 Tax=Abyssibacter sp. TaxID=2320200 RepID=UPI00321C0A91
MANALTAPRTQMIRSTAEQLPATPEDNALVCVIRERYRDDAFGFEVCAGAITKLLLGDVAALNLTRPWRDGGRDGIGALRLGRGAASIEVMFALEAKCYGEKNAVGVKETSRLISRIKHREFGVLVTTSYIAEQAYREITDDGHPVILVTSSDLVKILQSAGFGTPAQVSNWLDSLHRD